MYLACILTFRNTWEVQFLIALIKDTVYIKFRNMFALFFKVDELINEPACYTDHRLYRMSIRN